MDGPEPFLLRSFSQPSGNSPEPKEADLERALTSSISFGRFMSESLCWEKWSAFSRSRYLEEAKEYSTPGLVAQKKAYFDEYYKKIAENKAAALLEQQQATSSNTISQADVDESESRVVTDEVLEEEEVPYTDITFSDDAEVSNVLGHNQFSNLVDDSKSPIKVGLPDQRQYIEKESGDMFTQHQNIQKQRNEVASRQGGLVATLKKRLTSTGTKLRGSVKPSPVQLTEENNAGKTSKENNGSDFVEKKRGTSNSLHMSIDVGMPSKLPSSFRANIKDSKDIRTFAVTSKDSLIPLRTPVTVLVHSFSNTQPEKSDLKRSGSPVQKASPTAVASSFSFKNEERVAKHREFFQGLERKLTKETEKFHLPPRYKERSVDDFRKVWQTTDFSRPKPIGNPHRGTELQNHQLKAQIPLPQLPKPSKKLTPSISQSTECRPPWRVPGKIDSSKLGLEKTTQNAALSETPSWRKNKQENASPNIQP